MDLFIEVHHLCIVWKVIRILCNLKPYDRISCFFELRCNDIFFLCNIYRKRNKCRRNIDFVKTSWHRVFSTNRRQSESHLCTVSTKQCCKRLTPAFRIFAHSAEILLEGKTDLLIVTACCNDSCYRFYYSVNCTMIWAPGRQIWIKTICHHRYCITAALCNRKFGNHTLCLRKLIFSTIRHIYASCSDRTVKHLNQSLLGAYI